MPSLDSRIVMIGAGETNTNFSKYLVKRGFRNFFVFNRSLLNASRLSKYLCSDGINAEAYTLDQIKTFRKGFDILVVCTSSPDKFISSEIYSSLLCNEKNKKIIIDLSVPFQYR
jgi:glutamyl-tRNA reductase